MRDKEVIVLKGKIFIYYSKNGEVFRYPTGIDPKDQNTNENQKLIQTLVKKQRDIIYQYRLEHGENPPRDYIRLNMKNETLPKHSSLMDYYDEFYNFKKKQVENGNLRNASLVDYKNLRVAIAGFEAHTKRQLKLSDITEDLVNYFKVYINNIRHLNNNSTKKRLKSFKIFLNYCESNKYMKLGFDYSKVRIQSYDPTIVTLTESEFQNLKDWHSLKYQKVKDLFIFGCMTSLRYSDIVSLREHHIINDQIIKKSEKTNIQQIIPLTKISREILLRYNYNLNFYRTQTYNRLLKAMGRESKLFSSEVVIFGQQGNNRSETRKQKWECLESHTARRTFITRSITKGIPLNIIMGITGHTRIETLSRYMDKYSPTNGYRNLLEE